MLRCPIQESSTELQIPALRSGRDDKGKGGAFRRVDSWDEGTADPSTALVCETEESDALPKTDLFENQLLVHAPRTDFDCDGSPVRLYP
jgi:hypothetical protein